MKVALICTDNEPLGLGMRSISAVLKEQGYPARLIFMETEAKTYTPAELQAAAQLVSDAGVVGFSCMAQGSTKAKQILEYLRPLNKLTVWGGVHACLDPEDCAKWASLVCRGEGEGLIVELVERLMRGEDWQDMQNAAYLQDGRMVMNELRPLIANLDELPLPDFSFDDEHHLTPQGLSPVSNLSYVENNLQIAFTSSRGCAFYCTYCCNIKLKNLYQGKEHYVRRMSVGRLVDHSRHLKQIFPNAKYFYFIDEDFAARPLKELVELADTFPKMVGLPFECLAHPARITEQKLDLLVKAGLFRIRLGLETGSERTKKEIYNRHASNEAVIRAANIISKSGHVAPVYFFIIANPYEQGEDLLATLRLIEALPAGSLMQAFELTFFPGSLLYDRAIADGYISGRHDSGYDLNFYGGLHYGEYPWKKNNLYLNGLLFLAAGVCSRAWIGSLPRFLFEALISERAIRFNEKHLSPIKFFIRLKATLWYLRDLIGRLIKKVVKDPVALYNPRLYLRKLFQTNASSEG